MLGQFLSRFPFPPGQAWIAPLAGLVTMGLALLVVRALASRRTRSPSSVPEPPLPPDQQERRQTPRRGGRPVKVLLSNQKAESSPTVAWVQNRSTGGLCLAVAQQFEVCDILSVRAARAKKHIPWVQIEVKYCYLRDDSWLIGCRYLSDVPWNILLTFD